MIIALLSAAAVTVLGAIATVFIIGKPREPITPMVAAVTVLVQTFITGVLVLAAVKIGAV